MNKQRECGVLNKFSTSKQLIKNTKNFLQIKHYTFVDKLLGKKGVFYGWGRKKSGAKAITLAKRHGTSFVLLEDGFIRSVGLGVEGSRSFSIVEDDVGIYYDATAPSRLEELLNSYDFAADTALMAEARRAMDLILKYNISKYNSAPDVDEGFCIKYGLIDPRVPVGNALGCEPEDDESRLEMAGEILNRVQDDGVSSFRATIRNLMHDDGKVKSVDSRLRGNDENAPSFRATTRNLKRVLIIAQTAGDASLAYGMPDGYTTDEMITAAIEENPGARVYLKIHPDVLSGKKKSDIDIASAKERCTIIEENVNPLSLLKHFDKVYTKTSGMGFEALLAGCECVCFGMPFYAGWGVTDDRSVIPNSIGNLDPRVPAGNALGCKPEDDGEGHGNDVFLRRGRKLSVEEIFAAAYILYTRYHNPYTNKPSNIFDTIETIVKMRRQNIRELSH